uniref:RING-type E3 ubiquitin transferase n=1 Tax=Anthurium amnicola TaxID=1678845 RepID=A0A1D1YIU7_9ARAE
MDPLSPGTHPPPPPPPEVAPGGLDSRISPSVLLIIVVVAAVFFVSGLFHLLVRYLLRPGGRDTEEPDDVTAMQGRLQQLFHLHDAGVDQSFIDALPVFPYGAVTGAKDPFDCAICLCEFDPDDKLRLLPRCSHAFHLHCIDTWLLSHSTCPICRSSLLPDYLPRSPLVFVLESGEESSREVAPDDGEQDTPGSLAVGSPQKAGEAGVETPEAPEEPLVVPVKLGKFRNVDAGAGEGGEGSSVQERRCLSMGSFEYVMDETALLKVAIPPPERKPGHRPAMSDCDGNRRRDWSRWLPPARSAREWRWEDGAPVGTGNPQRRESFSISKTWLRPSAGEGLRRALSFRLPLQRGSSRRTPASEGEAATSSEKGKGEVGLDVEAAGAGGSRLVSRSEETPSFARRTLLWISGRHHKVVNHV